MGKRSDFERIDNDLYPTPLRGVLPLLPLLKAEGFRTFAGPRQRRKTRRTIFSRATMEGEMMKIIQSEAGETPDATTVRRDLDNWSRYDLEARIAFIDSAIEDLAVFYLKDGISALEDERERVEARLRDFDDDDAEEAEEDSV